MIARSFEEPALRGGDDGGVSMLRSGRREIGLSVFGEVCGVIGELMARIEMEGRLMSEKPAVCWTGLWIPGGYDKACLVRLSLSDGV